MSFRKNHVFKKKKLNQFEHRNDRFSNLPIRN